MTEEAAISLVNRYFDALDHGDHDAVLALLGDDVVHDAGGKREIGREKFRWALGLAGRHFRERFSDVAVMTSRDGTRAAAECTVRGTLSGRGGRISAGQRPELLDPGRPLLRDRERQALADHRISGPRRLAGATVARLRSDPCGQHERRMNRRFAACSGARCNSPRIASAKKG